MKILKKLRTASLNSEFNGSYKTSYLKFVLMIVVACLNSTLPVTTLRCSKEDQTLKLLINLNVTNYTCN